MTKAIVWVIKEQMLRGNDTGPAPMNFMPAMEWGDLMFVTKHDMPLYGRGTVQEQWNKDVASFVEQYNPMRDFVICTGQPMAICAVGFALGRADKVPRFLVWRREDNRYKAVNFEPPIAVPDHLSGIGAIA